MIPGPSSLSKNSPGCHSSVLGISKNKFERNLAHGLLGDAITIWEQSCKMQHLKYHKTKETLCSVVIVDVFCLLYLL